MNYSPTDLLGRPQGRFRTHGPGGKPSIEPFPFAGLDTATRPYPLDARGLEATRSLNSKYAGQVTPFGTPVAELIRTGGEMLVAPCGGCGVPVGRCGCSFTGASA